MNTSGALPQPQAKTPQHDIFLGADLNDIGEIAAAIAEDPLVLNSRETLTGKTALAIAAADGNYLALHFLLVEHGADAWISDKHNLLALDYARAIGHEGCRALLLQNMYPDLDGDDLTPGVIPLFPRR